MWTSVEIVCIKCEMSILQEFDIFMIYFTEERLDCYIYVFLFYALLKFQHQIIFKSF